MVLTDTNTTISSSDDSTKSSMMDKESLNKQISELEMELEEITANISALCKLDQEWRTTLDELIQQVAPPREAARSRVAVEEELQENSKQFGHGREVDDCCGSSSSGESDTGISSGDDVSSVYSSTDDDFAHTEDLAADSDDDDDSSSFVSWTTDEDVISYDSISIRSEVAGFDDGDDSSFDIHVLSRKGQLQIDGKHESDQDDEWDAFVQDRARIPVREYEESKQAKRVFDTGAVLDRIRKSEDNTRKVEGMKSEKDFGVEEAIVAGQSEVETEWDEFAKERANLPESEEETESKKKKRFRGLRKMMSRIFKRKQ